MDGPDKMLFHSFPHPVEEGDLPEKFTFPFCYTPHPLCIEASHLVQEQIALMDEDWQQELQEGKMFGVLLVRKPVCQTERSLGESIGFLAAFSGNVCGTNVHPYFVPPVYDLLDPQGFFKPEEARISRINHQIDGLLSSKEYLELVADRDFVEQQATQEIQVFREEMQRKKKERDARRSQLLAAQVGKPDIPSEEALQELIRESQFLKAELKRKEKSKRSVLAGLDGQIAVYRNEVSRLKEERKVRSAQLQNEIFEKYVLLNARGEKMNILQIFKKYSDREAPAGTGECAAPKLLQYAYLNHLEPLAMAEFWWGRSPVSEIRHHGHFYPSCHSKCEPLLTYMLEGLHVEENPLKSSPLKYNRLEEVFEDAWYLAVVKPAGLLSAPGKSCQEGLMNAEEDSVYSLVKSAHPDFTGPLILHRLDMATSGLLLIAKNREAYVRMQQLFESRKVRKRYVAVLDGAVASKPIQEKSVKGQIYLPLCPDINDRPRQMVSLEHGKEAVTEYQILSVEQGRTRIAFWPLTGRTHQLRVHAAHPQGLNTPILGDTLYGGSRQDRLYLHAESLEFVHPFTGRTIHLHAPVPF